MPGYKLRYRFHFKAFFIVTEQTAIAQTINWIKSVVIGCHFCPFAAQVMQQNTVRYVVLPHADGMRKNLEHLLREIRHLDQDATTETTFIIFTGSLRRFTSYLDFVKKAERLCSDKHYDGIYQLATFHPDYCFAGSDTDDPANYTNRSIYPMIHLLREASVTKAIARFPDPGSIPEKNMDYARSRGLQYMQWLRDSCL